MSKLEKVAPTSACHRMHVSAADFRKIKTADHLRMLFLLQLIREFEERLLDLKDANLMHGPAHFSIGQEANAAAAAVILKKSDLIGSTLRAHGHFLAKVKAAVSQAVAFCTSKNNGKRFIPDSNWPPPEDLVRDVRCEDDALNDVSFVEKADFDQYIFIRI